jgi:hypothetical protein
MVARRVIGDYSYGLEKTKVSDLAVKSEVKLVAGAELAQIPAMLELKKVVRTWLRRAHFYHSILWFRRSSQSPAKCLRRHATTLADSLAILLQNSVSWANSTSASTRSGGFFLPFSADADAGLMSFG